MHKIGGVVFGLVFAAVFSLGVGITIAPGPSVAACVPIQLAASAVLDPTDAGVTWSIPAPACGTVTDAGMFTSFRGKGPCIVNVNSVADPVQNSSITVNVLPETVQAVSMTESAVPLTTDAGITVGPGANVALLTAATTKFNATITTSCGTFAPGQ
jgi:hypothetical protein